MAANALADAGWDVVLVEANDEVGGAVRSAEVTAPGYVTDLFSAFYPLAAAAPDHPRPAPRGARPASGARAPHVLAHALDDGSAALLCSRAEDTAAGLEAEAPGDGDAWLELVRGLGPGPRPTARRAVHAVPAGRVGRPDAAPARAPPTPSTSPASPSPRSVGWGRSGSPARARVCC